MRRPLGRGRLPRARPRKRGAVFGPKKQVAKSEGPQWAFTLCDPFFRPKTAPKKQAGTEKSESETSAETSRPPPAPEDPCRGGRRPAKMAWAHEPRSAAPGMLLPPPVRPSSPPASSRRPRAPRAAWPPPLTRPLVASPGPRAPSAARHARRPVALPPAGHAATRPDRCPAAGAAGSPARGTREPPAQACSKRPPGAQRSTRPGASGLANLNGRCLQNETLTCPDPPSHATWQERALDEATSPQPAPPLPRGRSRGAPARASPAPRLALVDGPAVATLDRPRLDLRRTEHCPSPSRSAPLASAANLGHTRISTRGTGQRPGREWPRLGHDRTWGRGVGLTEGGDRQARRDNGPRRPDGQGKHSSTRGEDGGHDAGRQGNSGGEQAAGKGGRGRNPAGSLTGASEAGHQRSEGNWPRGRGATRERGLQNKRG